MPEKRLRLFDRLKKGLQEGTDHERGRCSLRTSEIEIPADPGSYGAEDVRRIRSRLKLSQSGFARLLLVSDKTIQSWEQGTRRPRQSSARLLQFIDNPELLSGLGK